MIVDDIQFKKDCLRRYYADMDISKAKRLKSKYETDKGKPTAKSRAFVKRVNVAKGYDLL